MRPQPKVIKLPEENIRVKKVVTKTNIPAVVRILKSIATNVDPAPSRH